MKLSSYRYVARTTLGILFLLAAVALLLLSFNRRGVAAGPSPDLPAAPLDSGPKSGFENFPAPGVLTQVASSSQGPTAHTVEYLGHDSGEPSIGVNPNTDVTNYQSDLQTLFITFDDSCAADKARASWVNRPSPTSLFVDSDPIGFTDKNTGRVFAGELTLTSGDAKTAYTDDDGVTWLPSAYGQGLGSSVDHETIGGGPYHAPLTRPTGTPVYPDAVYYCSQLPQAACARSDDGGANFGPIVPVDPVLDAHCGGLHGHVKVAPDGTVYLPFNTCDNIGSVIVSPDNGITWTIQHVQNDKFTTAANPNAQDPAVGIDANNKVYFAMSSKTATGSIAAVATSADGGQTWDNLYDVGAVYGIKNVAYPAAIAADADRAAVAFYGTTTGDSKDGGGESDDTFKGIWHLYVAETFDGGKTWTTTDATPNMPMQRGCIWMQGGADICRNLLDFFDINYDNDGRVQVGYVNGCAGAACEQAAATAVGNSYTALGVIARQSSGRRLIASKDPQTTTSAPGMPSIAAYREGPVAHLSWSEADDGNSPIMSYQILRGTDSGKEAPLVTLPGTQTSYDDITATETDKTYYYEVVASNAVGSSCAKNEVAAPFNGDSCTGMILQRTPPGHPEQSAQGAAPASLAIDYIAAGEPPNTNKLMFVMKVSSLASVPPNSRWRIVWNSYASPGQQFYIGMRTDASGTETFDYGTVATAVVGLVVGVPEETMVDTALPESNANADGTITIFVDKTKVGNPQPGDLLGAVNGRTFTGDTSQSGSFERSTALIDHTFVKAQRDNGEPPATYRITGNVVCAAAPSPTPTATPGPSGTATPTATPGPTGSPSATISPSATPTPSATVSPSATPSPTPSATPTATPSGTPAQLLDISTRMTVLTGDNVLIGGFIVNGNAPKKVLVRAIGPSLTVNGTPVDGRLADPVLELHDKDKQIASNDNWKDSQQADIEATNLAPKDDLDSAILMTLDPGAYTAIVRGKNDGTGIGLVEVYDLDQPDGTNVLANISTRGFVDTGDNVMIGGFIAGPEVNNATTVVIRGLGPSLAFSGVPNTLQNPTLELHDKNGTMVASNDDWETDPNADKVLLSGLAPSDTRESAIYTTVNPGEWTAVVRGADNTTGVGQVEIYDLR